VRGMVGSNSRSGGALDSQQPLRASATWRGKLDAEGRIGLAVGAGIDRLGSRQDALSTAGFSTVNGALVPNGALTKGETYTKSERISAMARLDFRPTEKLSLFAEYFYLSHDFTTSAHRARRSRHRPCPAHRLRPANSPARARITASTMPTAR
jgi:hypothetical protein